MKARLASLDAMVVAAFLAVLIAGLAGLILSSQSVLKQIRPICASYALNERQCKDAHTIVMKMQVSHETAVRMVARP